MHAKDVIPSDFLDNLGGDFVAATANGHVVSRASTRASLEHATKNLGEPVHIFSAADFDPNGSGPEPVVVEVPGDPEIGKAMSEAMLSGTGFTWTTVEGTEHVPLEEVVEPKAAAKKSAPKK